MTLNVAVDGTAAASTDFTSYLFVTQVKGGRPDPLPGGVLHGTTVRTDDGLRFSALELVLDTQESIPLEERRA